MPSNTTPPGWYPDQHDPRLVRYWSGREWTAQTAPNPWQPAADQFSSQLPGAVLPVAASTSPLDKWRALRRRTKVMIVVALLVLLGSVVPETPEGPAPAAASGSDDAPETEDDAPPVEEPESAEPESAETVEAAPEEEPSEEPEPVLMPGLRSQDVAGARAELRRSGVVVKIVKQASWTTAGVVLKQQVPAGTALSAGQVVTLVVASPMPAVPAVTGRASAAAVAALQKAGFVPRVTEKVVPSGQNGVILSQVPAGAKQAAPGSVVQLVVSNVVAPPPPPPPPPPPAASSCTTGYSPCLAPASDYDCGGGSGDGPMYAYGPIRVTGSDPYDLDSEGDGIACE